MPAISPAAEPCELLALVDEAVAANAAGRPTRAEELLDQVLTRIGPGLVPQELLTAAGRARVTLALTRFETGRRQEAFQLLDDAEALVSGVSGSAVGTVRVLAAIQRAGLEARLGHWDAALTTMQALGDVSETAGPRAAVALAVNSGLARQFLGDMDGSAADLEHGEHLARQHGIDDLAAVSLHDRGRLEFMRGHLGRALVLMDRASEMTGVRPSQSNLDRARVLLESGLLDAAGALLETGRRAAAQERLMHDLGEFTLEFARLALLQEEYPLARARAHEAAELFTEQQEPAWTTRAELLALEAEIAEGTVSPGLARRADALADGPAAAGDILSTSRLLAAEVGAKLGALDHAQARLDTIPDDQLSLPDRLQRHLVLATISAGTGDTSSVRRSLRAGAVALGSEQGRRSGLDARTAMALHGRRLQQLDVDLAMRTGPPEEIFDACERWRALSHRQPSLTPFEDPVLTTQLTALRQARMALQEELGEPADLRRRIALAEQQIQRRDWSGATDQDARAPLPPAIELTELRRRLTAHGGTGLVSYFVHRDRLRAVTVESTGERLRDLGPVSETTRLVRSLADALRDLGRASDPRLAEVIRRAADRAISALDVLLAPALPATARTVVLPSRLLASLPWRALPHLHHRVVTVSPSATFWANSPRPVPPRPGPRIAALAGPGLHRAVEEVESVSRAWPREQSTVERKATATTMKDALERCTVVHIAAHGTHHEQNPLFSSILLDDGPLVAHEFGQRSIGAEHIVLSMCDVGRAVVRPGDEPLGLTAALLASGVDSVVAAVAPVRDATAAPAMAAYHQQIAAGRDAAAALAAIAEDHPESRRFCVYGRDWRLPQDQHSVRAMT
ncbi:CHAT domain-containing protein [Brachybacterium avium]|nr:CHAT domain-containing protein [Brachybacterium avium]